MSQEQYQKYSDMLKNHAILEASAGTGKTYSIVEMLKILISQNSSSNPFSEILLLTFTIKATLELKIRIQQEIYHLYYQETDIRQKDRYLKWVQQLGELHVYTIHGFLHQCIPYLDTSKQFLNNTVHNIEEDSTDKILSKAREVFLALMRNRVQPGFFIGLSSDEIEFLIELSDINKDQWDKVFTKTKLEFNAPVNRKKLSQLINYYEYIYRSDSKETIQTQYSIKLVDKEGLNNLLLEIEEFFIVADLQSIINHLDDGKQSSKESRKLSLNLKKIVNETSIYEKIKILQDSFKDIFGKSLSTDKYRKEKGVGRLIPICKLIEELSEQVILYLALCIAKDSTQTNPIEYGFKGRLHLVNMLAAQSPDIASIPYLRFSYVFIDEFQDTNILEWETLKLLFLKQKNPPKILIIGDPKQAIYQFKGSDVNAYQKAKQDIIALHGKAYILDKNFRTNQALLDNLNTIFADNYFGDDIYGKSIYQKLTIGKESQKQLPNTQNPQLLLLSINEKNKFVPDDLKNLARTYVSYIQEYRIKNPGKSIAILASKHKHLAILKPLLQEYRVPYFYFGEKGLFSSPQAKQVQILFYAIYSSMQLDIVLALQTVFLNYEKDIENLEERHILAHQNLLFYRDIASKGQWALLRLELLYRSPLQKNVSPKDYEVFKQIIDKITAHMYESQRDLEYLCQYLRELSLPINQNHSENLYQFASLEEDRVELLTIHQSKGLEFDMVCLFLTFEQKNPSPPYIFKSIDNNGEYHSRVELFKSDEMYKQEELTINEKALLEQEKELKNLYYVALTRAKETLLLGFPSNNTNFLTKSLLSFSSLKIESGVLFQNIDLPFIFSEPKVLTNILQESKENSSLTPLKIEYFKDRTWQMVSYTSLTKQITKKELEPPKVEENLTSPILLPLGKNTGIFLHTILENMQFTYKGNLNQYVKDMMHKYSFVDIPYNIFIKIREQDFSEMIKDSEAKKLFQDTVLRQFLRYYYHLKKQNIIHIKKDIDYTDGLFHGELVNLIQNILNLILPKQNQTIQQILNHNSNQEMTFVFQPTKKISSKYIESTLDMLFIGDDGKIYFLDWKTDTLESYESYWLEAHAENQYSLQWKLYLIAMENFLQTFLYDFDYNQHIGGFYYVFVRGIQNPQSQGVYFREAPLKKEFEDIKEEMSNIINKEDK